jgi:hypothetical protein
MTTDRTEDYRAAYALFAASERRDGGMITELVTEYGAEALVNGLLSVCTRLRQALAEHAVECYCGSDSWLEQELYDKAKGG